MTVQESIGGHEAEVQGEIVLHDLTYRYAPSEPEVLRGVDVPPFPSSGIVETPRTATAPCEIRLQTTVHHGAARTSGASHSMVVPVCSKSPAVVFLPYSARKPRRCTASESFGRVVDFTSIGSR